MMANNWQRLNVWLKLSNKFDYAEYVTACEAAGVVPHSPLEFAQKAGMISAGMVKHPDLSAADAYLAFLGNGQQAGPLSQQATPSSSCSGCGGGAVR